MAVRISFSISRPGRRDGRKRRLDPGRVREAVLQQLFLRLRHLPCLYPGAFEAGKL